MLKKYRLPWVLLPLLLLPGPVPAQEMPHGKWWNMQRAIQYLSLNDEEKQKLDDAFVRSRRKLIDLRSQLERERFEVENLLDAEPLDEGALMEQLRRLEAARSALSAERFSFLIEVRKILGAERFQRLKSFYQRTRDQRRRPPMASPGRGD